jgi:regulator of cell morphogenesis and NO signaling
MTLVDPSSTLADMVVAAPHRAPLLEALRQDYCCHGQRSLTEACAQRGLDGPTIAAVLAALDEPWWSGRQDTHDLAGASVDELCQHIVHAHHGPLRTSMARIDHLVDTVVRVHRKEHPELDDLRRLFSGLRDELDHHMLVEEGTVFPAVCELERGTRADLGDETLAALEDDHADVGDALVALRELAGGYRTDRAFCGTHRVLLEALRDFSADLHRHIHEENNILFPQVRALVSAR